jgi:hypothetical protein
MVMNRLGNHQYRHNTFTTLVSLIASNHPHTYTKSDSLNQRVHVVIILLLYEYLVCTVYHLFHQIDVSYNLPDRHIPMIDASMYRPSLK